MAGRKKNETLSQVEDAKAAIRDSVERAKELIVEARFVIGHPETNGPEPPNQIT